MADFAPAPPAAAAASAQPAPAASVPGSVVRVLALTSAGGVLLGMLGPFGSYLNGSAPVRILYWVASMWCGLALYGAGLGLAMRRHAGGGRRFWALLLAWVLAASVPQAWATRSFAFWLWPELARLGLSPAIWYAQVVIIGMVVVPGTALAIRRARRSRSVAPSLAQSPSPPQSRPAPAAHAALFSSDVIALQMEDHYVRIHSPRGSELVLMPLARAIEAMAAVEGLKTHRSWWVARHAVVRVDGTARSMNLHLTNGLTAPVSRSAVTTLRAAGWL
ncbi:LytTR family transcriptional regulator [Sphingomonas changnyeongensis]|uniref:LytTR family transcriptional regulator n=1 Tax=Sphingomonas changnyeongensis TaxID=2698679 RepID=A0A7Z2S7D2_9SPHN|nr:LytTR family DNA-binding domain-containing protein [Sphingomonas changnyeongensis]QHL90241.1 LytTR family transcriptional regulator [Sphingomonas changnyeongensis]